MTDTLSAYRRHDFIRMSIDLLSAGAAWQGGKFVSSGGSLPDDLATAMDEAQLTEIARTMLLNGRAVVAVTVGEGVPPSIQLIQQGHTTSNTTTVAIERVESSFDRRARPILEPVLQSIELYEKALDQLPSNPAAAELIGYALPSIHSALAISPAMLHPTRVAATPPEGLMMGAIQFKSEVEGLRHNIRFGLDRVAQVFAESVGNKHISWEWNTDWLPTGMCKYGHVYQVFKTFGILLDPIKRSELGGIQLAAQTGLLSQSTQAECTASYGE